MRYLFFLFVLFAFSVAAKAQAPANGKAFEVRIGNGIVDGGVTQPAAIYIVFKDVATESSAVDIFCDLGNFAALPRPEGETAHQLAAAKRAFALAEIKALLRQTRHVPPPLGTHT